MIKKLLIFLVLNFIALAIGGLFTGSGVSSNWYQELNKAPWTPPGWVFGVAWTFIMVAFSFFMAFWWEIAEHKKGVAILFGIQWILNVSWNPIFFYAQQVILGLLVITSLTVLVSYLFFGNWKKLRIKIVFILPYLIWLVIATSLNAYIIFNN
ncbi:MAG: tryptophan-rich sensory protein [Flavobacteriales bacterium]|jgi:tryptophan-rich sensory protein|tara:strand:- start:1595 stop:2053 length:459 start_codon:yes stop_codon:yes gene_type:complete